MHTTRAPSRRHRRSSWWKTPTLFQLKCELRLLHDDLVSVSGHSQHDCRMLPVFVEQGLPGAFGASCSRLTTSLKS